MDLAQLQDICSRSILCFAYKEGMPEVRIKVRGRNGEIEYDAYLDTGVFKCLIPQTDAAKIGLPYAGDAEIITGTGKDHIKLYKATITFLNKDFSVLVLGRDLPEQATVKDHSWKRHFRQIQDVL